MGHPDAADMGDTNAAEVRIVPLTALGDFERCVDCLLYTSKAHSVVGNSNIVPGYIFTSHGDCCSALHNVALLHTKKNIT